MAAEGEVYSERGIFHYSVWRCSAMVMLFDVRTNVHVFRDRTYRHKRLCYSTEGNYI